MEKYQLYSGKYPLHTGIFLKISSNPRLLSIDSYHENAVLFHESSYKHATRQNVVYGIEGSLVSDLVLIGESEDLNEIQNLYDMYMLLDK